MLTVLDLFSGIGGFSLGLEQTGGFQTVSFCESNMFCRQVLHKHWPGILIYDDVCRLTEKDLYADGVIPDVITGGFPCQPFSHAGKRRGKADNRYLWPEMFRLIKGLRPTWVICENVTGIVHMALDTIISDLEGENYTTKTFVLPACSLNMPHRRDRVWVFAFKAKSQESIFTNTCSERLLQQGAIGRQAKISCIDSLSHGWSFQPVKPSICRTDHGIPNRVDRIKSLGNAVVPQIVMQIGYAILHSQGDINAKTQANRRQSC